MATKNPRIYVTLNPEDAEIVHILSEKKQVSMSSIIKKFVEDGLEGYEDYLLSRRADEANKRWEESGKITISQQDVWKKFDIQ